MPTPNEPQVEAAATNSKAPAAPGAPQRDKRKLAPTWLKAALLVYYVVIFGGLASAWSPLIRKMFAETDPVAPSDVILRYTILAALAGFLTGALHGIASLSKHAGRGDLYVSWWVFYAARPFTGAAMAVCMILLLSSGILGVKLDTANGPFVVLAWAALAGLFSTSALEKLRDTFDVVFQSSGAGESTAKRARRGSKDGIDGEIPEEPIAIPDTGSGPGIAAMSEKISEIAKSTNPALDASTKGTGT